MNKQEMTFWARMFECIPELSAERMQYWIENPMSLKSVLVKLADPQERELLNWLGTVTIPATTERFVVTDFFREDSEAVKFGGFYGSFKGDFLKGDGKIEKPTGEQVLRYGDLRQMAPDLPQKEGQLAIITELGGKAKAETTLRGMYHQLEKQGHGQKEGVLLTDGRANIFYIRNQCGVLRAVRADWRAGGWDVCANSVEDPDAWYAGHRAFSRNS